MIRDKLRQIESSARVMPHPRVLEKLVPPDEWGPCFDELKRRPDLWNFLRQLGSYRGIAVFLGASRFLVLLKYLLRAERCGSGSFDRCIEYLEGTAFAEVSAPDQAAVDEFQSFYASAQKFFATEAHVLRQMLEAHGLETQEMVSGEVGGMGDAIQGACVMMAFLEMTEEKLERKED